MNPHKIVKELSHKIGLWFDALVRLRRLLRRMLFYTLPLTILLTIAAWWFVAPRISVTYSSFAVMRPADELQLPNLLPDLETYWLPAFSDQN